MSKELTDAEKLLEVLRTMPKNDSRTVSMDKESYTIANCLSSLYRAFIKVGFTEEQAFQLTRDAISAALKR